MKTTMSILATLFTINLMVNVSFGQSSLAPKEDTHDARKIRATAINHPEVQRIKKIVESQGYTFVEAKTIKVSELPKEEKFKVYYGNKSFFAAVSTNSSLTIQAEYWGISNYNAMLGKDGEPVKLSSAKVKTGNTVLIYERTVGKTFDDSIKINTTSSSSSGEVVLMYFYKSKDNATKNASQNHSIDHFIK